jgi:hypothetical protein
VSASFVNLQSRRTLAAVYRFYDAFLFPVDERTPPITSLLDVSIPALGWRAFGSTADSTHRFSALTLTEPMAAQAGLEVQVEAPGGDYVNLDPILLTLPLPLSSPPQSADFLIAKPLWPTLKVRPPAGETAVRGSLASATLPVADLKVEMWLGPAPVPPPGTPFTRSNAQGDFLFRFPRLKAAAGPTLALRIRLDGGAAGVFPSSLTLPFGRTHIIPFQRT